MRFFIFFLVIIPFLSLTPGKDIPKVSLSFCGYEAPKVSSGFSDTSGKTNLDATPIPLSILKECGKVTVTLDKRAGKEYEGASIVSFTLIHSPPKGAHWPAYIEMYTSGDIRENMKARFQKAKPGDMLVLGNAKIAIDGGKKIVDGRGIVYIVTN
jgi:hypothetical protein